MKKRNLSYGNAIHEALYQTMEKDPSIMVMGEGVNDITGMFGSTLDLYKTFGKARMLDVPNSENGFTGIAVGAAINGMRPVIVHQRNDFLLLAMDQLASQAAKWSYMFDGRGHVPLVIRAVIGRGWGQGAQHSQSLQSLFMHFPGLKVAMPSNAYDAKGLLVTALTKEISPVMILEHRWLYKAETDVPEKLYTVPFGKGKIVKDGKDITIVAVSQALVDSLKAAAILGSHGISAEVIDPISLKPLDFELIKKSIKKTHKLVVVDTSWATCGFTAEIAARVLEDSDCFNALVVPIKRIACKDVPTPTTYALEKLYYPTPESIAADILHVMEKGISSIEEKFEEETFKSKKFVGSF